MRTESALSINYTVKAYKGRLDLATGQEDAVYQAQGTQIEHLLILILLEYLRFKWFKSV